MDEDKAGKPDNSSDIDVAQLQQSLDVARRDVVFARLREKEMRRNLLEASANPTLWRIKNMFRSGGPSFSILGIVRKIFKINFIRNFAHRVVPISVKTALINRINGTKEVAVDFGYERQGKPRSRIFRPKFEKVVPNVEQFKFALFCNTYPGLGRGYGGGFVRSRVQAYAQNGCKILVVEVNDVNKRAKFFPSESGGCLRIPIGDLADYLDAINAMPMKILTHSPTPNTLAAIMSKVEPSRCYHWFHGFEVRDYRRLFFNYSTDEMEQLRAVRDETHRARKEAASACFAQKESTKIFVSQYLKSIAEHDMDQVVENGHVIPNFIDCGHYKFIQKDPEDVRNILLIRTFQNKNYANDIVMDAIKILAERKGFNELKFTICGSGIQFEPLTNQIAHHKNVTLHKGHLNSDEMQKLHKENGVFLVPSRFDTQGVVMGEAMASGLVCITNGVAAIPEYADSECAILVRPDDALAYADAIWDLYQAPKKMHNLSKAAGERVRMQCGYGNTIKRELELISQDN